MGCHSSFDPQEGWLTKSLWRLKVDRKETCAADIAQRPLPYTEICLRYWLRDTYLAR